MKMRLAALGALIAAAATTACGRGTGTVRPLLTDAPAPANVQKVLITINEVRIKDEAEDAENRNEPDDDKPGLNGSPATHPEAEQDGVRGKGWIVLCTGLQTFDLLSLTNGRFAALCPNPIDVPAGKIDEIWLGVTAIKIVYTDGTSADIVVPRGHTNGLKLDLDDVLEHNGSLEINVDFDAGLSLILDSSGMVASLSPKLRELH